MSPNRLACSNPPTKSIALRKRSGSSRTVLLSPRYSDRKQSIDSRRKSMPRAVLSLDQGTTSSRAILFGESGRSLAIKHQEYPQIYPHPGWVEHNPEDIWQSQL